MKTTILITLIALTMLTVACAPVRGIKGDAGAPGQSVTGPQGPAGHDGATGPTGDVGPRGSDGEIATVIQLCPGYSNYGTFVETALCINNQLYGVYSANGGFLTLLAPGNYTSNAIGSACNLTVVANCGVVNY